MGHIVYWIYLKVYIEDSYIDMRVMQKILSLTQKKRAIAKHICCDNTLQLLKLEKLI